MNPVLSKLTMCVCAAGTGAAIVPAAKAIHHQISPKRVAHRSHAPAVATVATPQACLPVATMAGVGLGDGSSLVVLNANTPPPLIPATSGLTGFGTHVSTFDRDHFETGGGGGGNFGGRDGGGSGGGGGTVPPVASNAPEPASWALMVTGFGVLGGVMRFKKRATA